MPHPLLRAHPLLSSLADDLASHPGEASPDDGLPARAAVAIVLRSQVPEITSPAGQAEVVDRRSEVGSASLRSSLAQLDVLLIQRAEHPGDPWSGQIALPGGRQDPVDATLQDTAVRETFEETGINIAANGYVLGALDELRPRTPVLPPIIVTPFVAVVDSDLPLGSSEEVAEAFWAPWSLFADPTSGEESTVLVHGAEWRVNSYVVGSRVVWGMTERMLRQLAARLTRLAR